MEGNTKTAATIRADARRLLVDARELDRPTDPDDLIASRRLRWFADVDQAAKDSEAAAKALKKLREVAYDDVVAALEALDVDRYPLKGGPTVYVTSELWAGLDADDDMDQAARDAHKALACDALKAAGLGDLVAEGWNAQTLSGVFRAREAELEAEGELPELDDLIPDELDGFVKLTRKTYPKCKTS
jgi:hypothetical protein